ncbi:hypothetical protein Ava_D0036 [Trichormus variabilis ATCC 29413]|uniref:Uncharacterized protein n=2 Tax=Anabaena variabilis TaxID=264691 RepID=Q3M2T5_TRIV2|nr:hypothetical protein [Trichormus variabilis]ABA24701.1 hypothetical protein Ava_D0036 [Trichormus variabilis ATCC 29413]MBC1217741.1 hypothetical protein [Trichormus variabilis ARAD]MBC1258968.1 hypothetical protein [Trichormus variabilis V5]MBC1302679.1 hypothetical protein [Trichormus variabilis N2B]MBC1324534.1 hypothetical protein [Trichormus variabilis 9RC]
MNSQDIIQGIRAYIALDGQMVIVAADGTYLGIITADVSHPESICNPQGNYGSIYSTTSTQNPNSLYGGAHGIYSPYNPHCVQPPQLIVNNQNAGVISINPHLPQRERHDLNMILGILLGARYSAKSMAEVVLDSYSQNRATSAWLMNQTLGF